MHVVTADAHSDDGDHAGHRPLAGRRPTVLASSLLAYIDHSRSGTWTLPLNKTNLS